MSLRSDLERVSGDLDFLIRNTKEEARRQGMNPYLALATDGTPILAPLLTAQAQVLSALANLEAAR